MSRFTSAILLLASLVLSASLSPRFAQVVTGRVVSSTGSPVAGVNIDAFHSSSGVEADLANDGTDANGNFTTTIIDGPDVYDLVFYPPAPPASTHLVGQRDNVVVVTTTNVGTVTLGAGVLLSGRTIRTGTIPVANVTLSVIDLATGNTVLQGQDKTGAFGTFNLAVPPRRIELRLDATSTSFVLGSRALVRMMAGNLAMGDVLLPPGAIVTGHVQRTNGTPVGGADLDFIHASTSGEAFVPNDNTNALGNFSVVVGQGIYDIELCPKPSDSLVAKETLGVPILANLNTGTTTLIAGVTLSGVVRDGHGNPLVGVDVDAFRSSTGAAIPLCHDDTNAAGVYSVVVPTGTYDVWFTMPGKRPLDIHLDVPVPAATQLDGQIVAHGTTRRR